MQGRKTDDRRMCMSHLSAKDSGLEGMITPWRVLNSHRSFGWPVVPVHFFSGMIDPEVRGIAYL